MRKNLPLIVSQKIINDYLCSNDAKQNNKLPTQLELQKKYYVSRTTVLKAIDILRDENLVYSVQGKGMYFTPDCYSLYLNRIYSYDYQLNKDGIRLENYVLATHVCAANDELAKKLNIKRGDKVLEIIRKKVDCKTGRDLILQFNFLPYERFQNLDVTKLNDDRLYSILSKQFDVSLTSADEEVMISYITSEHSKYLDKPYGKVMRIDRVSYEQNNVVEFTNTYFLINSFKYDIKLNMQNPLL